MKKLIFTLSFLILLSPLAGCISDDRPITDSEENESPMEVIVKRVGVVEEKPLNVYDEGTHYLNQSTGDGRILLKSKKISLSQYIGKKTEVRGKLTHTKKNEEIIDVLSAKEAGGGESGISTKESAYKNDAMKFRVSIPSNVKTVEQESSVLLQREDEDIIKIYETDQEEMGTPVLISGIESTKVNNDDGGIIVYVPKDEKIYLVLEYLASEEPQETNKSIYFSMLDTLYLLNEVNEEGQMKCGGASKRRCPEGYFCELASSDALAEGVCVSIKNVADPKINPSEEDEKSQIKDNMVQASESRVQGYIREKISSLIPDEAAIDSSADINIEHFEFSDPDYVSVIYTVDGEKRKITFSYTIDEDLEDIKLEQKAYFKTGASTDWQLVSGENVQAGLEKRVVGGEDDIVTVIEEGYSLFTYPRKGFSTQYPKSWYYASFAGDTEKGILSHSVFSDESIEGDANTLVAIDILDESIEELGKTSLSEEQYDEQIKIYVKKDGETSFVVYGKSEYGEIIRVMAENLKIMEE